MTAHRSAKTPATPPLFATPAATGVAYTAAWTCPNVQCGAACSMPPVASKGQIFCALCKTDCPPQFIREVLCHPSGSSSPAASASSSASGSASPPSSPRTSGSAPASAASPSGPASRPGLSDQKAAELNVKPGKCESCGARILWAVFDKSGQPVPYDDKPHSGYVVMKGADGKYTGRTEYRASLTPHHATCPNAAQHRRQP